MLNLRLTALAAAIAMLSACATTETTATTAVDADKVRLEQELAASKAEQVRLANQVNNLQAVRPAPTAAATSTPLSATGGNGNDAYPINAKAGECYARVVNPPVFKTQTEKVVAKAASERVEVIPAKFEYVDEKVLVKPAGKKVVEVIPPVYRTVEDKVLVKAASERVEQLPATYKLVEEKQLVKPATTIWKKGHGPIEKLDNSSGEIMCLVEVPAEYRIVKSKVIDTAADVKRIPIAAEYSVVKRQELVKASEVREVETPAEYKTVKVLKTTVQAEEKHIPIPAEYQEVSRQVLVSEGSAEWKSILCETNTTSGIVQDIQRALLAKGFNPGKIDGVIGVETSSAIRGFQQANGLATGGLTIDTLNKLGVTVNRG